MLPRSRAAGFERQQGCAQSGSPTTGAEIDGMAGDDGTSRFAGPLEEVVEMGVLTPFIFRSN